MYNNADKSKGALEFTFTTLPANFWVRYGSRVANENISIPRRNLDPLKGRGSPQGREFVLRAGAEWWGLLLASH